MTQEEMVALIRAGVIDENASTSTSNGTWADFGAGSGNFTQALSDLLGSDATLYAVDRDDVALRQLAHRLPHVRTLQADFTQPLDLPPLDGLLIANALHFIRHQQHILELLLAYLKDEGRLLVVEYDVRMPRSYIPFPLPYERLEAQLHKIDIKNVRRIGERTSPRTQIPMYCAQAMKKLRRIN